ncbi:hypothetical protein H6784_04150 [Candidatus Nomurabacteria bacterium]|nr:hypothetical protein [Candidatus Kaiserbacteria bacterium]MCB9814579.1 hypothetical protein [Candidatus Nomurabacteria bacterium]
MSHVTEIDIHVVDSQAILGEEIDIDVLFYTERGSELSYSFEEQETWFICVLGVWWRFTQLLSYVQREYDEEEWYPELKFDNFERVVEPTNVVFERKSIHSWPGNKFTATNREEVMTLIFDC